MIQQIKMPAAGQTTDEARIVRVLVKAGDTVKRGDTLVEAETDKAVLPVESYAAGVVLEVLVKEGDDVSSGVPLAVIGSEEDRKSYAGSAGAPAQPRPAAPAPAPAQPSAPPAAGRSVKMPAAGQTTDRARIVRVLVKAGDTVKRGDALVEAETDKAVLPVESYLSGTVEAVLVKEGDDVGAGDVLVTFAGAEGVPAPEGGARVPQAAPAAGGALDGEEEYLPILPGAAPAPKGESPARPEGGRWPAMPNAKMLSRELGVDLSALVPANGVMLTRRDVRAAAQAAPAPKSAAAERETEYEVRAMSRTREVIGRRMLESAQTIPAWQCTVNVDMEACMALRRDFLERRGVKLSYNDILAKAVAVAARKFDLVNARYEQGEVRVFRHTNVGLAVGTEGALLVPVVRRVDELGLEELSGAYRTLVEKARALRLAPSEMGCGSVTISNLGMYDVDQFIAIVNPPESCILAVGRVEVQPVWDGEKFVPVHRMSITGSFDHRIIDGAYGAQFLRELKTLLEHPALMLG